MHKNATNQTISWLRKLSYRLTHQLKDRHALLKLLHGAQEQHIINNNTLCMIEGVLDVSQTQVREIMVHRGKMTIINHDATLEDITPIIIQSTHSRFPVVQDSVDKVIGIVLAKDLLKHWNTKESHTVTAEKLMRPVMFAPESKRIDKLLTEFRDNRYHMAIVVDEFGGTSGLITIEDILEQIVGSIKDETDLPLNEPNIKEIDQHNFDLKASTSLDEFNAFFNTTLHLDAVETIGGYLMQRAGHIPRKGEKIKVLHFTFTIIEASNRRIEICRVTLKNV